MLGTPGALQWDGKEFRLRSSWLSLCCLHSLRVEEKHEKYSPRQGEERPASRCYRCCDPGAPVYPAIPVPQINITILKGQAPAKTREQASERDLPLGVGREGGEQGQLSSKGEAEEIPFLRLLAPFREDRLERGLQVHDGRRV